jgi:hypothetical protein
LKLGQSFECSTLGGWIATRSELWLKRAKSKHHDRHVAVCGAGVECLLRIEDAAIRGI